jgi:hypothetical protein
MRGKVARGKVARGNVTARYCRRGSVARGNVRTVVSRNPLYVIFFFIYFFFYIKSSIQFHSILVPFLQIHAFLKQTSFSPKLTPLQTSSTLVGDLKIKIIFTTGY